VNGFQGLRKGPRWGKLGIASLEGRDAVRDQNRRRKKEIEPDINKAGRGIKGSDLGPVDMRKRKRKIVKAK